MKPAELQSYSPPSEVNFITKPFPALILTRHFRTSKLCAGHFNIDIVKSITPHIDPIFSTFTDSVWPTVHLILKSIHLIQALPLLKKTTHHNDRVNGRPSVTTKTLILRNLSMHDIYSCKNRMRGYIYILEGNFVHFFVKKAYVPQRIYGYWTQMCMTLLKLHFHMIIR